jgi:hypothetical protein
LSTLALAACLAATGARAGDAPEPQSGDARCRSLGVGFLAVPGSDACVRFSGYVAAGADTTPRGAAGPLQAPVAPGMSAGAGVALDAQTNTPMGPLRTYIQVNRPGFGP